MKFRMTFRYMSQAYVDIDADHVGNARMAALNTPRYLWIWPPMDLDTIDVIAYEIKPLEDGGDNGEGI